MYVVVNRLNKCQGAMGFHLQVRLLRWSRNTASGIREPTQLKSRPSASLARVDRRLLAPLFRQVYQRIRNAVLPPLGRKSRGMKILDAHQLGNRLLNVADARFR